MAGVRKRCTAAAVVLGLAAPALAGCSSSGSTAPTDGVPAAVAAVPVTAADLPSGWTAKPAYDTAPPLERASFDRCLHVPDRHSRVVAAQVGDDFLDRPESLSSAVGQLRSQADVRAEVAELRSPRLDGCYSALLRARFATHLPAAVTFAAHIDFQKASFRSDPNVVDVGRGRITLTDGSRHETIYTELAVITGRRLLATVSFVGEKAPFDPKLAAHVVTDVARRAAKV